MPCPRDEPAARRHCASICPRPPANRMFQGMSATSTRVRHIVELVGELSEQERTELEAELEGQEVSVGPAWGEEIDRRAARALRRESAPLSRAQLTALPEATPTEARAQLSQGLSSRR